MARYGQAFKDRAVARLLPPESAALDVVAREVGVGAGTLQRWRDDAQSRPARGRAWTAGARLEAVITTAAMNEAAKSAWCREHGVYPAELDKWRASCTSALADPEEARASPQATRADRKRIKELELRSRMEKQTQLFIETPYRNAAMLEALVAQCAPSTLICVATDLSLDTESVQTWNGGQWKKQLAAGKAPDFHKKPTVFLLLGQ